MIWILFTLSCFISFTMGSRYGSRMMLEAFDEYFDKRMEEITAKNLRKVVAEIGSELERRES